MQLEKSLAAHVPTSALFATDSQSSSNDPCNVKSENNKSLTIIEHKAPAAASVAAAPAAAATQNPGWEVNSWMRVPSGKEREGLHSRYDALRQCCQHHRTYASTHCIGGRLIRASWHCQGTRRSPCASRCDHLDSHGSQAAGRHLSHLCLTGLLDHLGGHSEFLRYVLQSPEQHPCCHAPLYTAHEEFEQSVILLVHPPGCLHLDFGVPNAEALVDLERRTLTLAAEAAVKAPVACSE